MWSPLLEPVSGLDPVSSGLARISRVDQTASGTKTTYYVGEVRSLNADALSN